MRNRRSLRIPRFDYLGPHRYFITYAAFRGEARFTSRDIVTLVTSQFLRACDETAFEIVTYCFMPDHVHLLIHGLESRANCKRFISKSKQYSGFQFKARYGQALWQRDAWESVLNSDDECRNVARYILANPVRAKLAERPHDYPYSGSFAWDAQALLLMMDPVSREGEEERKNGRLP